MTQLPIYVSLVTNNKIYIKHLNDDLRSKLTWLKKNEDFIEYNGEKQLSEIFEKLRNLEIAFAAGKEWSPVEIFEYLRDKGLLSGKFKKISWIRNNEFQISIE